MKKEVKMIKSKIDKMNEIDRMNNKDMFVYYTKFKKRIDDLKTNLDNEKEIFNYLISKMKHILDTDSNSILDTENTQEQDKRSGEKIVYPISEAPSIIEIKKMEEKYPSEIIDELEKEVEAEMYGKNSQNGLLENV